MSLADNPRNSDPDHLSELKTSVRWAVGCQEWDPMAERYVKRAYCPRTRKLLKSNEPERWVCSYEEALQVKEKYGLEYIVFLLTKEDPYHFFEYDDVGSVDDPRVRETIHEQNTYAEESLNGGGIHFIGKAVKSENQRKKDFRVKGIKSESYDRERLVVFTGKVIHDAPIRDVQGWVEKNIPTKKTQSKAIEPVPVDASDEEIIEKAQKDERFRKLFYEGDVSIYDNDDSVADMALCGMLAYWTGCDRERMDRIFRSSALMREKWNRDDYSQNTIKTAIGNCTSTYDPGKYQDTEEIVGELHTQRMNAQWKSMEACMVYRAHIALVEEHPWFVEKGEIKPIHGKDHIMPETGMLVYSCVRDLSLMSGIGYEEDPDPRKISKLNRRIEGETGLIRLISRGGPKKSSCFLLPIFSLRTQKKETQLFVEDMVTTPPVFPLCVLSENLLWIDPITTKEKFILEQVAWGRNTVQSLAEYFGMDEKGLLYRNLKPLENRGLLIKEGEEYIVSEERIEEMYTGAKGERAHESQRDRVSLDRKEYKESGEDANLKRSMEKIEAHLRGDIPVEDLTRWEKDQATGIRLRAVSKRKSRDDGLLVSGREVAILAGGTDE